MSVLNLYHRKTRNMPRHSNFVQRISREITTSIPGDHDLSSAPTAKAEPIFDHAHAAMSVAEYFDPSQHHTSLHTEHA